MKEYSKPEFWKGEYTCLHCNVLTKQIENIAYIKFNIKDKHIKTKGLVNNHIYYFTAVNKIIYAKQCKKCLDITIWSVNESEQNIKSEGEILFPKILLLIEPNKDMPDELKSLYNEARSIFYDSPKAAGALLRSVLEALIKERFPQHKNLFLGEILNKEDVINSMKNDLLELLKKIKNIGNDAAHPSLLIYEDEDKKNVEYLFEAINIFVHLFISTEKKLKN